MFEQRRSADLLHLLLHVSRQEFAELGMDLRTAASVLRGSHNGPVIEKGSPENSRLFQKVSKHLMPPPCLQERGA